MIEMQARENHLLQDFFCPIIAYVRGYRIASSYHICTPLLFMHNMSLMYVHNVTYYICMSVPYMHIPTSSYRICTTFVFQSYSLMQSACHQPTTIEKYLIFHLYNCHSYSWNSCFSSCILQTSNTIALVIVLAHIETFSTNRLYLHLFSERISLVAPSKSFLQGCHEETQSSHLFVLTSYHTELLMLEAL